MSQVLTVPTHFEDLAELSEGFLDRVEHDTLILYGPIPYPDGSEIDFVVLLADGSPALEGKGRVRAAVDGGAERVLETRYDVVVEALELEGRYAVIFERLVMTRQAVSDPAPAVEEDEHTESGDEAQASDAPEAIAATDVEEEGEEGFSLPPDEVVSVRPQELESVEDVDDDSMVEDDDEDEDDMEMSVEEVSGDEFEDGADGWEEESPLELSVDAQTLDAQATLEKFTNPEAEVSPLSEPPSADDADHDHAEISDASFREAFQPEVELDEDGQPLVAAEPNVGRPVPKPSIAAPPEAPPAPSGINVMPPPEGLTRPSRAVSDEELLAAYEVVGDDESSGLFEYSEGIPIPSRPPLPDPEASVGRVRRIEGSPLDDVQPELQALEDVEDVDDVEELEDSEPPEMHEDYEDVRLSELAESAEEG